MRRVPPVMAVVLLAIWLLLNNAVDLPSVVLGALLSIALLLAAARLRPLRPRMRRASVAIRLIFTVLADVMRSNISVGRVILGLAHSQQVRSAFIEVPLDLSDPHGLAALAMIITCTPGTIWANLTADRRVLTVHVLDLVDEALWVRTIKQRYERPLMEVFE